MQYVALIAQIMGFLNTPGGQQLVVGSVKTVEDLAGLVTGIVNSVHAGVQASAAAQTPAAAAGATVAAAPAA